MTNEELKIIREEKKQTKGEFAKLLGITPMVYGRYESGALKIPENIENAVKELASEASEAAAEAEIEVKKTSGAAGKAKETAQTKKTAVLIQSQFGGTISPEEVLERIPCGCDTVYIKPEENKAYWVRGDESGSIDLW